MHPVLIDFGKLTGGFIDVQLHTYGLMIATAFLVGMQLAVRDAKRIDLTKEKKFDQFVLDLCFWILIAAMVGARIVFIIVNWGDGYRQDPLKIFRVWEGGLVFYGGLIGAVLFSIYYSWRKGYKFLLVADTLIPMVALGQFFGRLGCFAAGCCWGMHAEADFFAGVQFPEGSLIFNSMQRAGEIAPNATHTMHVHPVQLYESIGTLSIFFVLQGLRRFKRVHGMLLVGYMFLYAILRSSLETVRFDRERGIYNVIGDFSMSTSQIISTGVALAATALSIYLIREVMTRKRPTAAA